MSPGEYAKTTDVPVSRSRDEIERTLTRFGATAFAYYANQGGEVAIQFEIQRLRVMMRMQLPDRGQAAFQRDSRGRQRVESAIARDWEQACRQRWRSLANGIKAKLALVDDGISTIEREFLSDVVLPSGETVGDRLIPEIREIARSGSVPSLAPAPSVTARVIELPIRAEGGQ